jgi:integrase
LYLGTDREQAGIAYRLWLQETLAMKPPGTDPSVPLGVLVRRYLTWARGFYQKHGKITGTYVSHRQALGFLTARFADLPAGDFTLKALKQVRDDILSHRGKKGRLARGQVNRLTKQIVQFFRWAAEEEAVPPEVYGALRVLRGLQKDRTPAPESDGVDPVSEEIVERTLAHMSPMFADMVRVQLACGCRCGEICIMRASDIDRSGPVWTYKPHRHKCEHHGHDRVVLLGPKAQDVLTPWLDCLIGPAWVWSYSSKGKSRVVNQRTYCHAVRRACKKAGVPVWVPSQLRHTALTRVRNQFGLEAAQVIAGHANLQQTEHYARANQGLAEKAAKEIG